MLKATGLPGEQPRVLRSQFAGLSNRAGCVLRSHAGIPLLRMTVLKNVRWAVGSRRRPGIPLWHTLTRWNAELDATHAEVAARAVPAPVLAQPPASAHETGSPAHAGAAGSLVR